MKSISPAILVILFCATVVFGAKPNDFLLKFDYDLKVNCYTENIDKTIVSIFESIETKKVARFGKKLGEYLVLHKTAIKGDNLRMNWNNTKDALGKLSGECVQCIYQSDDDKKPKCNTNYKTSVSQVFQDFGSYLREEIPEIYAKTAERLRQRCASLHIYSFFDSNK